MKLLEGLFGGKPDRQTGFSLPDHDSMRQVLMERAGTRFFQELDHRTQTRVSEVFARQDEGGLRALVSEFDRATVEGMALAMDRAVDEVIGEKSSYYGWVTSLDI